MQHSPDVQAMRALLAEHDRQERAVREAYAAGYRDGHASGWQVGYGRAHAEMATSWRDVAAQVRKLAGRRTVAEQAALDAASARGEPCQSRCRRCAMCARADAVARHGGDYLGRYAPPARRTA